MKALWLTLRETGRFVRSQRRLWLPFILVAVVELLVLLFVWAAPHAPFVYLVAPPIRYFFGERVLQHPASLWFLYYVMRYTHLIASVVLGAFMTGIACEMVRQTHAGERLSFREALVARRVRYGRVVMIWLCTWGAAKVLMGFVFPAAPDTTRLLAAGVGFALLLQALCVYAIPASVFNGSVWWKAILQGFWEALRRPFSTILVVALPSALVILFAVIAPEGRVAQLMLSTTPGIAFAFVAARLVVWTAADAILTVGIAHLWWFHRTPDAAREAVPAAAVASRTSTSSVSPMAIPAVQ